jgi:hypothetical protein
MAVDDEDWDDEAAMLLPMRLDIDADMQTIRRYMRTRNKRLNYEPITSLPHIFAFAYARIRAIKDVLADGTLLL